MHWQDDLELDDDGKLRKKRKRVLPDGAREYFTVTMMDAARARAGTDGSRDFTSPHQPGYRFADTNDEAKLRAQEAYAERSRRMSNAWKDKGDPQASESNNASASPRTRSLDEVRALADRAYRDRSERLRNAWRNRQQDVLATERPSPRTMDARQLADAAQRAYDERSKRLQNAWKQRQET